METVQIEVEEQELKCIIDSLRITKVRMENLNKDVPGLISNETIIYTDEMIDKYNNILNKNFK